MVKIADDEEVWFLFKGKKFTDDDIADHFYDEDWSWFKKNLGISPKNNADAELKISKWKEAYYKRLRSNLVKAQKDIRDNF